MAKKVDGYIKLQVPAGQANPSPPVGPALGQHGVNIMEFCKAFNAETQGTGTGPADSGGYHGLQRPQFYVHQEDAAGGGTAAKGGRHQEGQRRAET